MLPFPSEAVFGWSSGAEAPPLDSALVERHRQLAMLDMLVICIMLVIDGDPTHRSGRCGG